MKTISLKSIFTFILFTFISITMLANGLEFRLKLHTPENSRNLEDLSKFKPVRSHSCFVELGSYNDYLVAMQHQYLLEGFDIGNVEIVSYFNSTPIALTDAFAIINNRNQYEEKLSHPNSISEMEMESLLSQVQNKDFFYTIQLGIFKETNVEALFDIPNQIDKTLIERGFYRYTFGTFYCIDDAEEAIKNIEYYNLKDVKIIAFDGLKRISVTDALQKEKELQDHTLIEEKF